MQSRKELIAVIEEIAPPSLAAGWDNTGLQLGDPEALVGRVMVALDPLPEVVADAAEAGAGLLVTHHPLFFRDVKSLDLSRGQGASVRLAVQGGVAIYSAHTSLDRIPDGVSGVLAEMLGLKRTKPLEQAEGFPKGYGLGRVGDLPKAARLWEVAARLKRSLGIEAVRVIGDADKAVKRVAVCGGSGADLADAALHAGADLYVTGDVKYHDALKALEMGLSVLDVGHFGSELPAVDALANILRKAFMKKGFKVDVETSSVQLEPWTYL